MKQTNRARRWVCAGCRTRKNDSIYKSPRKDEKAKFDVKEAVL